MNPICQPWPDFGATTTLPTMPLTPAMRPSEANNKVADSPMSAPPIRGGRYALDNIFSHTSYALDFRYYGYVSNICKVGVGRFQPVQAVIRQNRGFIVARADGVFRPRHLCLPFCLNPPAPDYSSCG